MDENSGAVREIDSGSGGSSSYSSPAASDTSSRGTTGAASLRPSSPGKNAGSVTDISKESDQSRFSPSRELLNASPANKEKPSNLENFRSSWLSSILNKDEEKDKTTKGLSTEKGSESDGTEDTDGRKAGDSSKGARDSGSQAKEGIGDTQAKKEDNKSQGGSQKKGNEEQKASYRINLPQDRPSGAPPLNEPGANPDLARPHQGNQDIRYQTVNGKPFIQGEGDNNSIHPNDLKQGDLGDCYVFGALAALSSRNPDLIKNAITDNGNGTYTVNFKGMNARVTVDNQFPRNDGNNVYGGLGDRDRQGNNELWPSIIEKAWAKLNGGYENISGGNFNPGSGGFMQALTGRPTEALVPSQMSADQITSRLEQAWRDGRSVTFGTLKVENSDPRAAEVRKTGLVPWHGYAVMDLARGENGGLNMTAFNPWGWENNLSLNVSDIARHLDRIYIN